MPEVLSATEWIPTQASVSYFVHQNNLILLYGGKWWYTLATKWTIFIPYSGGYSLLSTVRGVLENWSTQNTTVATSINVKGSGFRVYLTASQISLPLKCYIEFRPFIRLQKFQRNPGWTFGVYCTRFLELPRLRSLLLIAKFALSSSTVSDNVIICVNLILS